MPSAWSQDQARREQPSRAQHCRRSTRAVRGRGGRDRISMCSQSETNVWCRRCGQPVAIVILAASQYTAREYMTARRSARSTWPRTVTRCAASERAGTHNAPRYCASPPRAPKQGRGPGPGLHTRTARAREHSNKAVAGDGWWDREREVVAMLCGCCCRSDMSVKRLGWRRLRVGDRVIMR